MTGRLFTVFASVSDMIEKSCLLQVQRLWNNLGSSVLSYISSKALTENERFGREVGGSWASAFTDRVLRLQFRSFSVLKFAELLFEFNLIMQK